MLNINHCSPAAVGVGQGTFTQVNEQRSGAMFEAKWLCGKIPCVSQLLNASRTFLSASGM